MDSTRHSGKVAIVTGGASGIGRATALRLAGEGAAVLAGDITAEGLETLTDEAKKSGLDIRTQTGNITVQADVDAIVEAANAIKGRIDILANVAGIMDGVFPAHEVDDATWDRVLAVNLTGPMMLTRAVLPGMMERASGSIVNVASVAGIRGGFAGAAYTSSKHGLIGLTRSVAAFYRDEGIRCNAVCPGGVTTNIMASQPARSAWASEHQSRRVSGGGTSADPGQIATLISWLASDEASNVSGAIITDDGAMTA